MNIAIDRNGFIVEHLLSVKGPCRVATTANITLSGTQTIDGVVVEDGDRVLVKDQTDDRENAIYVVGTSEWDLANDFDQRGHVVRGTRVLVTDGTTQAMTEWVVTTTGTPRPGRSSIAFENMNASLSAQDIGGPLTITTSGVTQGLVTSQTGPTSGSTAGPLVFNHTEASFSAGLTGVGGPGADHGPWVSGFQFNLSVGGSNLDVVASYGASVGLIHTDNDTCDGDKTGFSSGVYSNKTSPGKVYGGASAFTIDTGGSTPQGMGHEVDVFITGTVTNAAGYNSWSGGPSPATGTYSAYAIGRSGEVGSAQWKSGFVLYTQDGTTGTPIAATGSLFTSDHTTSIADIFNFGNVTVTGNILSFPHTALSGPGTLRLGSPTSIGGIDLEGTAAGNISNVFTFNSVPIWSWGATATSLYFNKVGGSTAALSIAVATNRVTAGNGFATPTIYDTNGNELFIFTSTASAINELTLANAAVGTAPTLSATGDDTDISINFLPKGSGVFNFLATASHSTRIRLYEDADNGGSAVAIAAPSSLAGDQTLTLPDATDTLVGLNTSDILTNKTLTAPKIANGDFIADANGNELIIFTTTASAVNELTLANGGTGVNPKWTASGETNVGMDFQAKGTGTYRFLGTGSQAAEIRLHEDTDDGSNYTAFKVGTQAGDITYTLPTDDGDSDEFLRSNGSGVLSWEPPVVAGGGIAVTATTVSVNTNNAVGIGAYAIFRNSSGGTVNAGATTASSGLGVIQSWNDAGDTTTSGNPTGTWRNVTGANVSNNNWGFWIRTA